MRAVRRHSRSSVKKLIADAMDRVSRRPVHSGPWVPPLSPNYLARAPSSPPRQRTSRPISHGAKRSPGFLVAGTRNAASALEELRTTSSEELRTLRDDSSVPELVAALFAGSPADRWASSAAVAAAAQLAARQLSDEVGRRLNTETLGLRV